MRILFVVAYPAAARVRPRELIRALARRGPDLTVATLWKTGADWAGLEALQSQGVRVISAHQSKVRSLWNNERYRAFRRSLRRNGLFPGCVGCCDLIYTG